MTHDPTATTRGEPPTAYRWVALFFISLAMFANYYVYDAINPLTDILENQLGFTNSDIGWLNTSYSIAAIVTLIIGGVIIDRFGTRRSILLFSVICLAGAGLTAFRGTVGWMISGRVVLGLGAESLIVAITTALAKWFRGKELGFAFGVNLTIARLGSLAADRSPSWAEFAFYPQGEGTTVSWQGPLILALALGTLGVVGAIVYWELERRGQSRYSLGKAGEVDRLELSGLFRFGKSYWFIVGLCFAFYSAVFAFRTFAVKFLMHTHFGGLPEADAREAAGALNSMLPTAAMIATPIFGLLVDKVGRRALLMLFGSVLLLPVFLLLAYASVPTWVPFVLLGTAFSLIPAVMWPSVAYIVEEKRLGSAYALMTLIQQIGLAGMNWGLGFANDQFGAGAENPGGYLCGMWVLSGLGVLAIVFAFLLRRAETGPGAHGLERPRPPST